MFNEFEYKSIYDSNKSFYDLTEKNKEYNYMVCIPRKLDIFKYKEQKLA